MQHVNLSTNLTAALKGPFRNRGPKSASQFWHIFTLAALLSPLVWRVSSVAFEGAPLLERCQGRQQEEQWNWHMTLCYRSWSHGRIPSWDCVRVEFASPIIWTEVAGLLLEQLSSFGIEGKIIRPEEDGITFCSCLELQGRQRRRVLCSSSHPLLPSCVLVLFASQKDTRELEALTLFVPLVWNRRMWEVSLCVLLFHRWGKRPSWWPSCLPGWKGRKSKGLCAPWEWGSAWVTVKKKGF